MPGFQSHTAASHEKASRLTEPLLVLEKDITTQLDSPQKQAQSLQINFVPFSTQMTTYKLHYFNARGRGELSRYLFAVAGVPYEDLRYSLPSRGVTEGLDFNEKVKESFPFGQMPVLDVTKDGKTTSIAQSHAIERYLARQFGLMGSTDEEAGVIESITEGILDIIVAYMTARRNPNKEESEKGVKLFFDETLGKNYALFARFYTNNTTGSGWAVGDKVSLADIALFLQFDYYDDQDSVRKVLDHYPVLSEVREKVRPLLSDWIAKRPVTQF